MHTLGFYRLETLVHNYSEFDQYIRRKQHDINQCQPCTLSSFIEIKASFQPIENVHENQQQF